MASLEALTKSYRAKKVEVSKLRKKNENSLRETLSLKRRSSSGLASLQRRKEALERQASHVSQLLNQYRSQKESIARLKADTEERLKRELDIQDGTRQQVDYGPAEEKAAAQERLRSIEERISDLRASTKERDAAEGRLERQISDLEGQKARLDSQMKKQVHAKPALVEQLKASSKVESVLRPRVQSLIKREAQAAKTLQSIEKKLAESRAKVRKAKRKPARKAKRKPARKAKARTRGKSARRSVARTRTKTRAAKKKTRKSPRKKLPRRTSVKRTKKSRASRHRR
ncbi:MAG: hypothetical protein KGI08_05930 [Thaumarchaeota archaeon]|nr:hypothetical protein [Nitrososphaerota archaeon]